MYNPHNYKSRKFLKDKLIEHFISFMKFDEISNRDEKEELAKKLDTYSKVKKYQPKDVVYDMEDMAKNIYYIHSGLCKIVDTNKKGEEITIRFVRGKNIIGLIALERDTKYPFRAIALEESYALEIDREFMEYILSKKELSYIIMKNILAKTRKLGREIISMSTLTAKERFMEFLQESNSKNTLINNTNMRELIIPLKNYEIASNLKIKPEVLSRITRELINEGKIYKAEGKLYLKNLK